MNAQREVRAVATIAQAPLKRGTVVAKFMPVIGEPMAGSFYAFFGSEKRITRLLTVRRHFFIWIRYRRRIIFSPGRAGEN